LEQITFLGKIELIMSASPLRYIMLRMSILLSIKWASLNTLRNAISSQISLILAFMALIIVVEFSSAIDGTIIEV